MSRVFRWICEFLVRRKEIIDKFLLWIIIWLSHKDWESTEFTNLIGWNRYWLRSRFSHLDRHLDRFHFALKM